MTLFRIRLDEPDPNVLPAALTTLCEHDCDMNGENGPEFTWQAAKDGGFPSNAEYLADIIMKDETLKTPKEKFEAFAAEFFRTNLDYYKDYEIDFIEDDDELTVAFCIW